MPDTARAKRAAAACALAAVPLTVVLLTACDPPVSPAGEPAPSTTPSPYTATGTTLPFGHPATVPWQDADPKNAPAGMIGLAPTEASGGGYLGGALPDPDTPPSFNDVTFFVRFSIENTGKIPVHPETFLFDVHVYDSKGSEMIPASKTIPDEGCVESGGALAPGATTTSCKYYLGNVLAPKIAKVVYDGYVRPATKITWTNP